MGWSDVTLWLFKSLPWYRWPIEIDCKNLGLPINSMVIFHGYVSHNQMVSDMYGQKLDIYIYVDIWK